MSKFLDSRSNDLQGFGRYKVGQQIPYEISIKMAIESHGFIYSTLLLFCFHSCRNLRRVAPLTPDSDDPAVALSGAYSSVVVVTDVTHPYIRVGDGVSLSIYLKYNLYNEPLMWVCLFDLTNLSLQKSLTQFKV